MLTMADHERTGLRPPPRRRRVVISARVKILASYVILLALSTATSVLLIRQILLIRLEEEIDEQFTQEVREFRRLARGSDPDTGEPFGSDVRSIFDVYFSRNVPDEGEALLSFVGGRPYLAARSNAASYPLEDDRALVARWAALLDPERGEVVTAVGDARYIAVPVLDGTEPLGVFVVANFPLHEREEVDGAVRVATAVTLGVLLVASALAWILAGRVLAPVRVLTDTARSISEADLTRRIRVSGHDELSRLAETFNDMLDRLEDAFRTQRRFADDAGHELRTPITVIRGHLELLEDDPEERRETLALVADELDRMNRIVDDLLLLAKAEQPDFLSLDTVDVERLTDDVLAKAQALGIQEWRLDGRGKGRIVADQQRLTQALMQLAENAARYAPGDGVIAIGSAVRDGEARFWVRDRGPGIEPEDRERIFTRFARGPASRRRSEGAGLGLSIVEAIAQGHHGRVELETEPGVGSTFTLVIPTDQPVTPSGAEP
jgi:signal transduction histidine kinase